MAAHGDERSPAVLDRTSTRAMVEKGEGSDGVERAARHGAAEGPGSGSEKLCHLAMAAKAVAPAAAERRGRRRARGSSRESQWTRRARALSLEEQGVRQRVAQSLDARQPWRGVLCAWLPRRHFVEHVARVAVLDLEAIIGMLAC